MKNIQDHHLLKANMDTICLNIFFLRIMEIFQMWVTLVNRVMFLILPIVDPIKWILSKILLKTPMEPEDLHNKQASMICNQIISIQLCSVNNNTFFLKMLKIFQIRTTIINRETWFQQDTNTILKAKLTLKIMIFKQTANIQWCLVNKKAAMFYQKTHKISQTLMTIANRATLFQLVTTTILKVKHISKIMICNQIVNIQLCSVKKKTKSLTSISIIINTIITMFKTNQKFKLVLNKKKFQTKKFLFQSQFQLHLLHQ